MYDKLITQKKSIQIKGIIVSLMVIHHLFAFPKRINSVEYYSLMKINEIPIEYYLGLFGKICVSCFLFLSGYGLFISYYKKSITYKAIYLRVLSFYKNFWVIFFIFISFGLYIGAIEFNIYKILLSFLGISSSYNGEWWYIQVYIILLITYPVIRKISDKFDLRMNVLGTISLYILGLLLVKLNISFNIKLIGVISNVLIHQVYFMLGYIICRFRLYDKFKSKFNIYINNWLLLISIYVIFMCYFIISKIPILDNFTFIFLSPVFIYLLANFKKSYKSILFIGKYSTNIWLVHSFFCYYYFQRICFMPKYSILIFLLTMCLSIGASLGVELIHNNLIKFIKRSKEENIKCNKSLSEF